LILIPFFPNFNLPATAIPEELIFAGKNNRIRYRRKEVVKASSIQFFGNFGKMSGCDSGSGLEAIKRWTDRQSKSHKIRVPKGSHTRRQWETLKEQFAHTCPGCGSKGKLTKDHRISKAYGRRHNTPYWNSIENIQPLCSKCNQAKGDRSFSYWRDDNGKIIMRR